MLFRKLYKFLKVAVFSVIILFGSNLSKAAVDATNLGSFSEFNLVNTSGKVTFLYYIEGEDPLNAGLNINNGEGSITITNVGNEDAVFNAFFNGVDINLFFFSPFTELISSDFKDNQQDKRIDVSKEFRIRASDHQPSLTLNDTTTPLKQGQNVYILPAKSEMKFIPMDNVNPVDKGQFPIKPAELSSIALGDMGYGVIKKSCYRGGSENINKAITSCKDHPDDTDIALIQSEDDQIDEVYLLHKKYFEFISQPGSPPAIDFVMTEDGFCNVRPDDSDLFQEVRIYKLALDTQWNTGDPVETYKNVKGVQFKPYEGECGFNITDPDNQYYPLIPQATKTLMQNGGVKVIVLAPSDLGATGIKLTAPNYEDGPSGPKGPSVGAPGDIKIPDETDGSVNGAAGGCRLNTNPSSNIIWGFFPIILFIYTLRFNGKKQERIK